MSLMDDFKIPCVRVVPKQDTEAEGGTKTKWVDGEAFEAAIVYDNSIAAKRAAREGVTSLYTVTTDKSLRFAFHDVFRRLSDGKVFRVTTSGNEKCTPACASFDVAQFSAEEWRLPT